MMLVLKLPIVYLCLVVWWAVRMPEDRPLDGAAVQVLPGDGPCGAGRRRGRSRPHVPRPHGGTVRSYPRTAAARARAEQ